jgi:hypothetical protein
MDIQVLPEQQASDKSKAKRKNLWGTFKTAWEQGKRRYN